MLITRDNYESWFLQYVDGELTSAQMKLVEQFVSLNPDLSAELRSLQQVTMVPGELNFPGKESLFRKESETASEEMLLMLDGELPQREALELEGLIKNDPHLAAAWAMLLRTRVTAEAEVFFDEKASLYRREKREIISMKFFRYASAAIITGILLFTGARLWRDAVNEKSHTGPVTARIESARPDTRISNTNPDNNSKERITNAPLKQSTGAISMPGAQVSSGFEKAPTPHRKKLLRGRLENFNKGKSNFSDRLDVQNKDEVETVLKRRVLETSVAGNEPKQAKPVGLTAPDVEISRVEPIPMAKLAAMADEGPEETNSIMFLDGDKLAAGKVGKFLKKVKRTIDKRSGFKPFKNGIHIGDFEIAAK